MKASAVAEMDGLNRLEHVDVRVSHAAYHELAYAKGGKCSNLRRDRVGSVG